MTENEMKPETNEVPLEGWKEIAAHMQRDSRTVKRWEKDEDLPVHRHQHQARATVYAYPSELDAWRENRKPAAAMSGWLWQRPARAVAMTVVVLLAVVTMGSGPITSAADGDEPGGSGMTTRQVWAGGAVELFGDVSPDGRYLTSTDMRATGNLIIRDIVAGTNKPLTDKTSWRNSSEYANHSLFSPDGQRVAYSWFSMEKYPGTDLLSFELRVVNRDGSGVRRLYRNREISYIRPDGWTPDGRWILSLLQTQIPHNYQIAFISTEDGSVRVLKSLDWRRPRRMSLSPDGKTIVYDFPASEESPQRDIYLLAADGSREETIVNHSANDFYPVWTPAGDAVLFTSDRTGQMGLWKLPVSGGARAGTPYMVKPNLGRMVPLGFAPGGVLYYGVESGLKDVVTATLEPDADGFVSPPVSAVESYVGGNTTPDWSPDGKYLSYVSRRGTSVQGAESKVLVIRSLESGEERILDPDVNIFTGLSVPRWSPDSRSLVSMGRNKSGRFDFYQIDAETGAHKMVVDSPGGGRNQRNPVWLRDGKSIIHERKGIGKGDLTLFVHDTVTGTERILYHSRHIHAWALSPDGEYVTLSVSSEDQGSDPEVSEGDGGVFFANVLVVIPVTGGGAREILRIPKDEEFMGVAWAPGGRQILFLRISVKEDKVPDERPRAWRIPAAGGEALRINLAFWPNEMRSIRLHPDGRQLVYEAGPPTNEPKKEIWVLENFLPKPEVAHAEQ